MVYIDSVKNCLFTHSWHVSQTDRRKCDLSHKNFHKIWLGSIIIFHIYVSVKGFRFRFCERSIFAVYQAANVMPQNDVIAINWLRNYVW